MFTPTDFARTMLAQSVRETFLEVWEANVSLILGYKSTGIW